MLFTKASEYALAAVITISKNGAIDAASLADSLNFSPSFLAKVMQCLAKADILNSKKGAGGGFELAKTPENITIEEVLRAVGDDSAKVFQCVGSLHDCPNGGENRSATCMVRPLWVGLQKKIDDVLAATTIADLMQE